MSIQIKVVDDFPKKVFSELVKRNLESKGVFINESEYLSKGDSSFKVNQKPLRVGAFDNEKLIGLSFGFAETKNRFLMCLSLVEADYRDQGIYKQMLETVLENTREFDEVDSCHQIFNNKIIALKLKKEFHIIGIENSIFAGPLIRMRYFNNEKLLDFMKFRVGLTDKPHYKNEN